MPGLLSAIPLLGQTSSTNTGTGGVGPERVITEGIGITPIPSVIKATLASLTQGIGAHDALATPIRGIVIIERLHIALAQVANQKVRLSIADNVMLHEALRVAVPVALLQGIGIAVTQQVQLAVEIVEELGLAPTISPTLKYHLSMLETIGVADALARFLGASISEGFTFSDVMVSSGLKPVIVSEGIGIAATLTPKLILRVTVAEGVEFDDAQIINMIYRPVLTEGIELSAAYLAPDGSFATWAINTRTGAVTEYDNYAFNSFARIGDRYIGASEDGLFELLGDDDDGADIIASLKSGFAQWAGSKFTMFKAAYIGVRGGGNYVLRVTTGDGKTYNYAVSARDMRTTKVRIGKGIRTRYFAFELISTGQDFDLDSIEFVPLVTDRRV